MSERRTFLKQFVGLLSAPALIGLSEFGKRKREAFRVTPQTVDQQAGRIARKWRDAGFVYTPYVPLQVTPAFLDPSDFTMKKGIRTRWLNPDYYGVITVSERETS